METNNEGIVATVGDLIEHLEKNFKPDDMLCWWYEGGAWMECEHVGKSDLGKMMFFYVGDKKAELLKEYEKYRPEDFELEKRIIGETYCMVQDGDVVIW